VKPSNNTLSRLSQLHRRSLPALVTQPKDNNSEFVKRRGLASIPLDASTNPRRKKPRGCASTTVMPPRVTPDQSLHVMDSTYGSSTTYRVRQIPNTYDEDSFRDALHTSLELDQLAEPKIHSFATDVSSASRCRTSTISFRSRPASLSSSSVFEANITTE
jgi:hypothetical protein